MAIGDISCDRCGKMFHWSEIREHRRHCDRPEREHESLEDFTRGLPRVDDACSHPGCPNFADDGNLCRAHSWEAEHPGEQYDPFEDFRAPGESSRACNPRFPRSAHEERRPSSRNASGMGRGDDRPSKEEYERCKACGQPHHRSDDEQLEAKCENRENHRKREAPARPEWPSGYEATYAEEEDEEIEPDDDAAYEDELPADEQSEEDEEYAEESWEGIW